MHIANIYEAKTHLSKLLCKAAAGEEVIIAKAGKPVAKLMAFEDTQKPRFFGLWKGKAWISDDFDEENEDINKLFYEGEIEPTA